MNDVSINIKNVVNGYTINVYIYPREAGRSVERTYIMSSWAEVVKWVEANDVSGIKE